MTAEAKAQGAQPQGANDERAAAAAVQQMFNEIAQRYDLLNHILSMNVDRLWWWRTARSVRHILQQPNARVLDLCCGTGDMARALRKQSASVQIAGADFSHQMLRHGQQKFGRYAIDAAEADALNLPFADNSFNAVTCAFGFRNLANYDAGLGEIYRVLQRGGAVRILDFSEPGGVLGKLYAFYFRRVLPRIGAAISGSAAAYTYLPASVARFPTPAEMQEKMRATGFDAVSWKPYSFGIAGLYRATKR